MPKQPPKRAFEGPGGALPIKEGDDAAVDLAMLLEGETSGRPLDEVLDEFGRCRSSYYEKRSRYERDGLAGLLPRQPGPRAPWRRSYEVIRAIVRHRLDHPDHGARDIASALERAGHRVSVRSVERTLSEFGLTRRNGDAA